MCSWLMSFPMWALFICPHCRNVSLSVRREQYATLSLTRKVLRHAAAERVCVRTSWRLMALIHGEPNTYSNMCVYVYASTCAHMLLSSKWTTDGNGWEGSVQHRCLSDFTCLYGNVMTTKAALHLHGLSVFLLTVSCLSLRKCSWP